MSRKMKKWLKRYPMGAGRLANMDCPTFFILEVGDDQRSEEMAKKLSQCWQASGDGPYSLVYFRTGRWEMCGTVKNWSKSYPSAGRLVKMDFHTFCLLIHGG